VAPQRDICPTGRTYPRKALPISKRRRPHPLNHTPPCLIPLKRTPRKRWAYTIKKKRLAPLE